MSAVHAEPFEPIVSRRGRGNLGVASWALSALVHVALAGVALLAVLLSNQPPPEPITVRLELVEAASPMVEHLASSAETSPAVAPSRAPDSVIAPAPPEVTQEPPVPPTPETVPVQPDGLSALRAVEPAPAPQPAKARPPQPRQVAQRAGDCAALRLQHRDSEQGSGRARP